MTFSSSSSHDDFAPKRKVVEGEDEALSLIKEHIDSNPIMLYMKGNPSMPMCKKQQKACFSVIYSLIFDWNLLLIFLSFFPRWILGSSGASLEVRRRRF